MAKFYDREDCIRKSNQESELGSLALNDNDKEDAKIHFEKSKVWMQRAKDGGWEETK